MPKQKLLKCKVLREGLSQNLKDKRIEPEIGDIISVSESAFSYLVSENWLEPISRRRESSEENEDV